MRTLLAIILIYLFVSCDNAHQRKQLIGFYDPFLSEISKHREVIMTTKNCFPWIDSCYNRTYKFRYGSITEFSSGNNHDPIEIKFDSLFQVPNYIRPDRIVPEPIYQNDISEIDNILKLYWYEIEFRDILDSTKYFFNDNGKVVRIENNIDFLSPSIIYKFSMGFSNFGLNDSLIYLNGNLKLKITKCTIQKNCRDVYNVVPLVSVTNYTYDDKNKLTKIFTVHKFKDSSQNYNCEIFFENGLPKYKIENNIRQEYQISSL